MKEKLEQIFNKHHYGYGEYDKDEIIKELLVLYNVIEQSQQFKCEKCGSDWGEIRHTCYSCSHEFGDL